MLIKEKANIDLRIADLDKKINSAELTVDIKP
jgi:hypothetical protein